MDKDCVTPILQVKRAYSTAETSEDTQLSRLLLSHFLPKVYFSDILLDTLIAGIKKYEWIKFLFIAYFFRLISKTAVFIIVYQTAQYPQVQTSLSQRGLKWTDQISCWGVTQANKKVS